MSTGINLAALATLPEKAILDEAALAEMFSVSPRTISRWSANGDLPPPARMGSRKFWAAGRILAHIESRLNLGQATAHRRNDTARRAQTP